jgi:hypothetical protein
VLATKRLRDELSRISRPGRGHVTVIEAEQTTNRLRDESSTGRVNASQPSTLSRVSAMGRSSDATDERCASH